jgi:hypothetical protein
MGVREINYERAGQTAYDAYAAARGNVSVRGDVLWSWREMKERDPAVADAWCVAAQAVLTVFGAKGN